jgi:hypothetical protein
MLALLTAMALGTARDVGATLPMTACVTWSRDQVRVGMTWEQVQQIVKEQPALLAISGIDGTSSTFYAETKLVVSYRKGKVLKIHKW